MKAITHRLTSYVLLIAISMSLLLPSCSKSSNDSLVNTSLSDIEKLEKFLKSHDTTSSIVKLSSAIEDKTITTKSGNVIYFPSNVFVKKDGSAPQGEIVINIREIVRPSDMVYADKTTLTSDGKLLQSYGMFYIGAMAGKDSLKVNLNPLYEQGGIAVQLANPAVRNLKVPIWNGDTSIVTYSGGYTYQNQATIISEVTSVNPGVLWNQTSDVVGLEDGQSVFQIFDCFEWKNCDVIIDNGTKTTLLGYFGDKFNDSTTTEYSGMMPTMLFYKPDGFNSVVKLYNIIKGSPAQYNGLLSYQNSIPVGGTGKLLAFSYLNGILYAQIQNITIANTGTNYMGVNLNLNVVTESQLAGMIATLNN